MNSDARISKETRRLGCTKAFDKRWRKRRARNKIASASRRKNRGG